MLIINKSINLSGTSDIEGTAVVHMHALISRESGSVNINKSTLNKTLYEANKTEVRNDMAEFELTVFEIEDEIKVLEEVVEVDEAIETDEVVEVEEVVIETGEVIEVDDELVETEEGVETDEVK